MWKNRIFKKIIIFEFIVEKSIFKLNEFLNSEDNNIATFAATDDTAGAADDKDDNDDIDDMDEVKDSSNDKNNGGDDENKEDPRYNIY